MAHDKVTEQEMCEAVVKSLAGGRYFMFKDASAGLSWVVEADFNDGTIVVHGSPGATPTPITNNTVTLEFIKNTVERGLWREVNRPEWLR